MTAPPRLETPRLLLRSFEVRDIDDVFAYAREAEFSRYLLSHVPYPYARQNAAQYVADCMARNSATQTDWAIEYRGRVVGGIDARVEPAERRASIGYGIARTEWGQGLTTEAARAVVDWLFATFGLDRVFATADARNVASRRVMEHVGMEYAATQPGARIGREGAPVDQVTYGMTLADWEATRSA